MQNMGWVPNNPLTSMDTVHVYPFNWQLPYKSAHFKYFLRMELNFQMLYI